jgi:hypothetical protein
MPVALLKQKEVRESRDESDATRSELTAIVKEKITASELSRAIAALFGEQRLKRNQHFQIDVTADGPKLRIRRVFDPREAGITTAERLQSAEGGAWTAKELEKKFQLSPATLHRRRKEHRIIYWRDATHDFHYPKWQFTPTGALLAGIQEILESFKSDDEWRVMRYFLMPRKNLRNETPLTLLLAGRKDHVIGHAKAHAEENTW